MFATVPTDKIRPLNPIRPLSPKRLSILTPSIADLGVLQPGLAIDQGDGTYGLFAGFHRFASCDQLGKDMPLHIFPSGLSLDKMVIMAMAENNARASMNFADRADSLLLVQRETGLSLTAAGEMCSMSPSEVSQIKQAMENLDESVCLKLANANIGHSKAYELSKHSHERQRELVDDVLNGMTVADLKKLTSKPRVTNIKIQTPGSYPDLVAQLTEQVNRVKALEKQRIPFSIVFKVL